MKGILLFFSVCVLHTLTNPEISKAQVLERFTDAPIPLTRTITFSSGEDEQQHFNNTSLFRYLYFSNFKNIEVDQTGIRPDCLLFPCLSLVPINIQSSFSSRVPYSVNRGPAWAGRGLSSSISGGASLKWAIFDIQLAPTFMYAQNTTFPEPSDLFTDDVAKVYYEPYRFYDRPARLDSSSIGRSYLGESWAKLALGPVSAGVSNQNLWWGPGRRNSLLMSNNAPGFRHVTIHTNRPVDLWLGNFQFEYMGGRLERSYFNDRPVRDYNDWRFLTALLVDFEPRFIPGLQVGLIRAFHIRPRDLKNRSDYFPIFQPFQKSRLPQGGSLGDGSAPDDQRASVYFNWYFSESEFSFYGEFARTDHASDIRDLFLQPNHARAYLMGINKKFNIVESVKWSLSAELTDISNTMPSRVRLWREGQPPQDLFFYIHVAGLHHGYNHLGREVGSHYGMGSSAWFLSLERYSDSFKSGIMAEYIRRNRVTYLAYSDRYGNSARQQVDMSIGGYAEHQIFNGFATVTLSTYVMYVSNQYYMPVETSQRESAYRSFMNWYTNISLRFGLFGS